ncbi:unnamed protein product [Rotaria socialis]|uniref:acylglycerol lipase n=1 Tax=Rotaria socialis TaxID=392032 RepID=A0A818XEU8_9BILA|nr:unnamed protein product [Rotaria socialis]
MIGNGPNLLFLTSQLFSRCSTTESKRQNRSIKDAENMQAWLTQCYYQFNTYRAGLQKRSLSIDANGTSMFSYCEKGKKMHGQPTVVFIHGLSSNKETWLPIVKNIPNDYHCITVDLPAHGETVGMKEEFYTIDKFVEKLKLFFDKMNLIEPMFIIGASMGGAVVSMFAIKYPNYVSLICLLAPPADEKYETARIKQLRQGNYEVLLPETTEQLSDMIRSLTVKPIRLPEIFLNGFLRLRLPLLEEHTNVLKSLLEHDYPYLNQRYQELNQISCPTLILWGREDQLFTVDGAHYFLKLIPKSEAIIFDDCGHFMAIDKPLEVAENFQLKLKMSKLYSGFHSMANRNKQSSPFELMMNAKREEIQSKRYIPGKASDFYFLCHNGKIDCVRQILDAPDSPSIETLNALQPNGNTALHAAVFYNHIEIVKILLERKCPQTTVNRFGNIAYDEAKTTEMQQLFNRPDTSERFHDTNTTHSLEMYVVSEHYDNTNTNVKFNYVREFQSDDEISEHSINQQTLAMWLKFYTWFTKKFRNYLERDEYHIDAFDLDKHADFQAFLQHNVSNSNNYKFTMNLISEAQNSNSLEPLIKLYTSEEAKMYTSLNKHLASSSTDSHMGPHLCD